MALTTVKLQLNNKDLKPPILPLVLVAYAWGFKIQQRQPEIAVWPSSPCNSSSSVVKASEHHGLDSRRGFRFLCARDSKNTSSFIFKYNLGNIQCHWKEKTNYFSTSTKIKLFCSCVLICRRWQLVEMETLGTMLCDMRRRCTEEESNMHWSSSDSWWKRLRREWRTDAIL